MKQYSFNVCMVPLIIFPFISLAQEWVARYNGPGNAYDEAFSLAVDGQGNVYVTGYSMGSGTDNDYATIKYDSAGVEQWVQRYDGPGNSADWASALAIDGQGNVYVTGYSTGSGTSLDYATIKYDATGNEQWVKRYNGPADGDDWASSLVTDSQQNVYVTGGDYGVNTNSDYATIKYDSSGVQEWVRRYNGPASSYDAAYSLAVDGHGNVYVTGESYGAGTECECATIKYDSTGTILWLQRYDGPAHSIDYGRSLAIDGQGNVYVTGVSFDPATQCNYLTIKYDSSGVEQWVQTYNGPGSNGDFAFSLAVDGQGNVYVTGESWSGISDDYATIKYDSAGVEQWVQRYNGPGNDGDYARSLVLDGQSNVYVTGYSTGSGANYDYATIKYDSAGNEQWIRRYDGPGNGDDCAWPLALDEQGNVYVAGVSYDSVTYEDYATIKYTQEPGIQEKFSEKLENILRAYPNPVKDISTIQYSLTKPNYVNLNLYNCIGTKITTLVDKFEDAGNKSIELNTNNLASGVYFCILTIDEKSTSKKVVVSH